MASSQARPQISGAGSANATGGRSMVLENGYSFSNTIEGYDFEASPICLSVTTPHNGNNSWVSPYFNCTTAIDGTASNNNVLINPQYAAVTNYGPISTGFTVIGFGSRAQWMFPAVSSYTAAPVDDGMAISSYNAPGASLAVTLPAIAAVNPGWSMGFASDNSKGMTVSVPDSARILSGGRQLASITLGTGNYEYVKLQADGNNWRVTSMTRATALNNGFAPPPWPSNWLYPSSSGYSATLGDNGNTLSSYNTSAGLTVTLPATSTLPDGWSMGFATDNGKPLTVNAGGAHILYPGSGATVTSVTMATQFTGQVAYEYMVIQYDNNSAGGNFRIISATPATLASLAPNALGQTGITRWTLPSGSTSYAASAADNGNMISSYNSSGSSLTVTLPPTTALNQGWTIGIAQDNGKTASVQVNGTSGGQILVGGTLGAVSSFSLAGNYENAILQYDGSNFRVVHMSPLTADTLGALIGSGTPASSSAPCQTAQLEQDANYLYICTAPNTWKRIALTTF